MKSFLLVFLMLSWAWPALSLGSPRPDNFQYRAEVKGFPVPGVLHRLHLPAGVIASCRSDLGDLRLFDGQGNEVPQVVLLNVIPTEPGRIYRLSVAGYSQDDNGAVLLLKMPETAQVVSAMDLNVAGANFRKQVVVEGSTDGVVWNPLGTDVIFDFTAQVDLRKTRLAFKAAVGPWFRVRIQDIDDEPGLVGLAVGGVFFAVEGGPKRLRIDGVTAMSDPQEHKPPVLDRLKLTDFMRREDGQGNTILQVKSGLPATSLELSVADPYFHRTVTVWEQEEIGGEGLLNLGSGAIYRFPLTGTEQSLTRLDLPGVTAPYLRVVVANRDNRPLDIPSMFLAWPQRLLFFIPGQDDGPYTLYWGADHVLRPSYDLSRFVTQANWAGQKSRQLSIGAVEIVRDYKPYPGGDRKDRIERIVLLTLVVVLIPLLGFWLLKLLPRGAGPRHEQ